MSGFINKIKEQAAGYKDAETGKTGYAGVMAEGQEQWKAYNEDKKDGHVDWKKLGTDAFGDIKAGLGGGKTPAAPGQPPAQPPAQQPPK